MQSTVLPLDDHPEFSLIRAQGWREYRVHALPSSRFANTWADACVVLGAAYYWQQAISRTYGVPILTLVVISYIYTRLSRILWESVVIFPSLGMQLETHRGVAGRSLFASRKFVPWSALEDFLINEGIRGWDIRYYLVAIERVPQGSLKLQVAFENLLPRFPVLLEVYHGVQDALHNENERAARSRAKEDSGC